MIGSCEGWLVSGMVVVFEWKVFEVRNGFA